MGLSRLYYEKLKQGLSKMDNPKSRSAAHIGVASVIASILAAGVVEFKVGDISSDPQARPDAYTHTMHIDFVRSLQREHKVRDSRLEDHFTRVWDQLGSDRDDMTRLRQAVKEADKASQDRHNAVMEVLHRLILRHHREYDNANSNTSHSSFRVQES